MKISTQKTITFIGKEPERTKIVIDNRTLEQFSHFNYVGCDVTYDYSKDCEHKLNKFTQLLRNYKQIIEEQRPKKL